MAKHRARRTPPRVAEPGVPAGEFKARCLALMDRVREYGEEVVITKRGVPVAKLVPVVPRPATLVGALAGTVLGYGDLIAPVDAVWDAQDDG